MHHKGAKKVMLANVKFDARAKRGRQSHEAKYPFALDAHYIFCPAPSIFCPSENVTSRLDSLKMCYIYLTNFVSRDGATKSTFVGLCDTSLQTVSGLQPLVGKVNKRT